MVGCYGSGRLEIVSPARSCGPVSGKGEWMRYTIEIDDVIFGHFNAKDWEHALKKAIYFWPSETRLALRISLVWDKGEGDLIETTEK